MTSAPAIQTLLDRLHTPPQDLAQLSFCKSSRESGVKAWLDALPLTQINFASMQFYRALPEIVRLQTQAETRLAMLELLRLPVLHSVQGLSQHFLNQPLILPETARKTATLAQALQKHLTNGYLISVRELCSQPPPHGEPLRKHQALAISRAMTGLGLLLVRGYQLYTPIASQVWTELHTLYLLAEQLDLLDSPVDDPLPHHRGIKTIEQAYIRLLLLACARPNQMRQDEVLISYQALEHLSALGKLSAYNPMRKDNLFAVMLDSGQPPAYKSRLNLPGSHLVRELSTHAIAARLQELGKVENNAETPRLAAEQQLTPALCGHLIQAWNILAQRSFDRRPANGHLQVTVGLSNIHYHIAGRVPFTVFLNQMPGYKQGEEKTGLFRKHGIQLKAQAPNLDDDPWGNAHDVGGNPLAGADLPTLNIERSIRQQEQQEYKGQHPLHQVPLIDASPGGYCLEWQGEIPSQVKVGELLGIQEEGRQKWAIGVVRWVQQTQGATQMGIQVLSPQATPVGIALIHKTGGFSDYLRALQLPSLKAINQPASLITNAVSFREYNKVRLFYGQSPQHDGEVHQVSAQLTQRLFSTGSFSQFAFRELASTTPTDKGSDDFDAVWKT